MKCACGFAAKLDPRSAAYHRAHRAVHLEVFQGVDLATRKNLDEIVRVFELREARQGDTVVVDVERHS